MSSDAKLNFGNLRGGAFDVTIRTDFAKMYPKASPVYDGQVHRALSEWMTIMQGAAEPSSGQKPAMILAYIGSGSDDEIAHASICTRDDIASLNAIHDMDSRKNAILEFMGIPDAERASIVKLRTLDITSVDLGMEKFKVAPDKMTIDMTVLDPNEVIKDETITPQYSPASVESVVMTYLVCPNCKTRTNHTVNHIVETGRGVFGPWTCEHCRAEIFGRVNKKTNTLEVHADMDNPSRTDKGYHLLCIPPMQKPIYFVVSGSVSSTKTPEEVANSNGYYYNSHTCPTNFLRSVVAMCYSQDPDPHGVFRYVGSVKASDVPAALDGDGDFDSEKIAAAFPTVDHCADSIDVDDLPRSDEGRWE